MDPIYSEPSEENDFTDHTIKRRISSILKAPRLRSPLRDLVNVNVTEDSSVEKPQRNSRRVSFADTIRFYPSDPQTISELDHAVAEKAAEARDQAALHQNEDLNVVQCDITEMNTLLHAPIQTSLEQTECYDADKGREWNKMGRTLIFSEENEMDMTAGHTIMITHDIGMSRTEKPGKEDCIFSDYLKSNKEASELKEFSFFSNPTKVKETSISQKKPHFENTQKINLDDFLKSFKSSKLFSVPTAEGPFASSEVPERSMHSSEENDYFNSQKQKYNTLDSFCRQENRTAVEEYCVSAEKAIAPPTGHPLGCGEVMLTYENQSTEKIFANTGRILPPETSSLNKVNQQEIKSVRRGCMVTHRTDSCGLKASSYQLDVEQDPRMCTVNNEEARTAKKPSVRVTSSNASLASHLGKSIVPVPFGSAASMSAFHVDKTTVFSGFCADTEMTGNCTHLIWDENSKHTGNLCSLSEKQRNDISSLMEETVFEENIVDITNNQASTNSCLNNMQHSIPYNEMAALNQSSTNMGLNPRLNSGSWGSSPLERKGNSLPVSLPQDRSAVFSAKNIDLRIQVAKSNIKQAKSQFLPLSNSVVSFHQTMSVETKADGKSRISDNAVSLFPLDKTVYYEDMEITKPTTCLTDKALKTAHFQDVPHQESRTDKKSVTCLDSDKTVVFPLSDDNEMEIMKSCSGAINYDIMQQLVQVSQAPTSQPINKTIYQYYSDMEETKPTTYITDQSLEAIGPPAVRKLENEAGGRTLIGATKEKTVVFSLTDENEMEITKSHTVALNHDIPQQKGIPNTSAVPSDKTVMFTFGDDVEITKPAVCETVKCLKNLTGSFNRPTGSAADKTVMSSHSRGDEIELTKSLTVTLEGQAHTSVPTGQPSTSLIGSNTMPTKSTTCVPGDKTVMFRHHDDMGITKPIMHTSNTPLENTGFETSSQNKTGRMILPDSVKDATHLLYEDKEMEITKSHTVAVNHDIIQQMKVGAQRLASDPSDKMDVAAHGSNNAITKSACVPAEKTIIFVDNKTMEITRPITDVFPRLIHFSAFSQEASNILLPGSLKDSVLMLSENEMEITKSHTVAVSRDIVSQYEKTPQAPFVWNDVNVAECHTVAKRNTHTNLVKPGKPVEWELSSDQMFEAMADDMKTLKNHSMPLGSKTDLNNQPASQAELALALCNIGALESFQDNAEVTNLLFNTIGNGNLVRSKKQEISNKRIQESRDSMQTSICAGETKDTIYGSINNLSNAEKCIPNSSMKLEEKTIPFLDNTEMTENYTTGIELMHTNAFKNECHLLSQEKLNSDLPNSVDLYGIKLGVDKGTIEKSICSANVMPSASQTIVQERQRSLKIKVEPYTSNHINLSNKTASNALYHYEKKGSVWPKEMPTQNSKLTEETTLDLNTEKMCMLATENENLKTDPRKLSQLKQEGNCTGGAANVLVDDKETKNYKTASCEQDSITKDWQTNLNIPSEEKLQLSGIVNDCSKRNDSGNMSELVMSQNIEPVPGEQMPKLMMKLQDPLVLKESVKKFNSCFASNDMTNKSMMEDAPFSVPLTIIGQNHSQMTKLPLGIFPPKLPNRRKSAIYNVEEICARSGEKPEIQDSENISLIKKPSDKFMQNFSPSHYIDEELLPECAEEMDFNESLHYEGLENPCNMMHEREINNHEGHLPEIVENNRQKRTWNQEGEELQKEKKFKVDESWNDTAKSKQPLSNSVIAHSHVDEGKNVPDLRTTNLERTQSSNSSSLDSLKADTDFSIQSNEMEAQLFIDSICQQNLQEKLQDGVITVREFFTLLQVHVLIQMPRQSQLPPNYAVNAAPTPEDAILSQYVYRPKLKAYGEDYQILSDTIEELKQHVGDQDKLLVNVNKSLWEVMKTCSDEELKGFGAELNKMKSFFTKKSKVLVHREKTKLYAKLLHNAQFQWEKLQSKLAKVDEFIKEMDSCRIALETETANLENADLDLGDSRAEYESKLKDTENEIKDCKAQEEALQREPSNLRDQKQQRVSEITHLQENVKNCQELLKKYNFSEWVLKEWDDHQAVFTFLYDSIELTVEFGRPVDDPVLSSKFCRKIVGVNFKSLLDETKASPSSKLVYRLIFQFINSHTSWQEKCSTLHHLSQMLQDISLVVSRCHLLGREIDFLDRWGGKFSLLKSEVNVTKVKLLFSSSVALAKFEVELSLSASYPASPLAFTVSKCKGKLGQEEISAVLSSVPVGANYLKRMINQIHHNLLQGPSTVPKQQR